MNRTKRTDGEQQRLLAYIRGNYEYLPETGGLRNRKTGHRLAALLFGRKYPRYHFRFNGKMYYISVHIAVFVVCMGRWPTMQIDHMNGDRFDNRIENLRECTTSVNQLNRFHPWRPNSVTGIPGVVPCRRLYQVKIRGLNLYFHNKYEAFWAAVMCGKRYE